MINPSKTVYNTEWGCPKGGEETITITGVANPAFVKDIGLWKDSVLVIAKKLKSKLGQSTLTIEFTEVNELVYLQE